MKQECKRWRKRDYRSGLWTRDEIRGVKWHVHESQLHSVVYLDAALGAEARALAASAAGRRRVLEREEDEVAPADAHGGRSMRHLQVGLLVHRARCARAVRAARTRADHCAKPVFESEASSGQIRRVAE